MSFSSWRGTVGLVKPTMRPGQIEEVIRLLPDGIYVLPLFNNIRQGVRQEFSEVIKGFESRVEQLAQAGVDLIHPSGAPPFMILGYEAEKALIRDWEKRFGVPIFTSGTNVLQAMRVLKAKRVLGITYTPGDVNKDYAKYFVDAGFEVTDMRCMDVEFHKAQEVSLREVYRFIRDLYIANPTSDAIYVQGPSFHMLDIIEMLEQDLGVPIIHQSPAQCWEIMRRLHVNQPVKGFGRLIAEMPDLP